MVAMQQVRLDDVRIHQVYEPATDQPVGYVEIRGTVDGNRKGNNFRVPVAFLVPLSATLAARLISGLVQLDWPAGFEAEDREQ